MQMKYTDLPGLAIFPAADYNTTCRTCFKQIYMVTNKSLKLLQS